jgi:hypothetical protein
MLGVLEERPKKTAFGQKPWKRGRLIRVLWRGTGVPVVSSYGRDGSRRFSSLQLALSAAVFQKIIHIRFSGMMK